MSAKIITVFNQKGGCGKTTISIHLAGTIARRGNKVLLVDMDIQSTATRWVAQAEDGNPFPATLTNLAAMEGKVHRELRNHEQLYDYIIIDCPPALNSPAPSSAMLVSDLAIIPVVLSPADIWAAIPAKELALQAQVTNEDLKIAFLPNMVQPNTTMAKEALSVLTDDEEIPVLESRIGSRSAYRECQLNGDTIHSIPRATKGINEVESLVDEVLSILHPQKGK